MLETEKSLLERIVANPIIQSWRNWNKIKPPQYKKQNYFQAIISEKNKSLLESNYSETFYIEENVVYFKQTDEPLDTNLYDIICWTEIPELKINL